MKRIAKCKDCGIDLAQLSEDERDEHANETLCQQQGQSDCYGSKTTTIYERRKKHEYSEKILDKVAVGCII